MALNETPIRVPAPVPANAPGRRRRPVGFVDHHMAGYLPGTDGLFRNPSTGYATNIGIGSDGRGNYEIHEYVPEDQVAWGNGNDHLNEVAISIEHENDRANGSASKPTLETHELSARYMAAAAIRWDMRIDGKVQLVLRDFPNHDFYGRRVPGFGTEFNVIGHRAVALKDCPRYFDMEWQVARANEIINGGPAEKPKGNPMSFLGQHPTGAVTEFFETSADGVTAGEFAYLLPAHYGVFVPMSDEAYRQELINVEVRAAKFAARCAGTKLTAEQEAQIRAQVPLGIDAWLEKHADRTAGVVEKVDQLKALGLAVAAPAVP